MNLIPNSNHAVVASEEKIRFSPKQNLKSIQRTMKVMLIILWYHVLQNRLLIGSFFLEVQGVVLGCPRKLV